jgi:hypothetical protein
MLGSVELANINASCVLPGQRITAFMNLKTILSNWY